MALTVQFADGARGALLEMPTEAGVPARVRLDDGREVQIPADQLQWRGDACFVPLSLADIMAAGETLSVIPLISEELEIGTRRMETGVVRIQKRVTEREEVVDEPTIHESAHIERVPIHRLVSGPIPDRYEGDTLVLSLLEEVLVVEKRLMLTEEVRVRLERSETRAPQRVTLRREEVIIERQGLNDTQEPPQT